MLSICGMQRLEFSVVLVFRSAKSQVMIKLQNTKIYCCWLFRFDYLVKLSTCITNFVYFMEAIGTLSVLNDLNKLKQRF